MNAVADCGHRCNRKGALVGAVIGAAIGALLVRSTCDSGDCSISYVKYMGVLGGIGAGVGAFAHVRAPTPIAFPARRPPGAAGLSP